MFTQVVPPKFPKGSGPNLFEELKSRLKTGPEELGKFVQLYDERIRKSFCDSKPAEPPHPLNNLARLLEGDEVCAAVELLKNDGQLIVASNWVDHSDFSVLFTPFIEIPRIDEKPQILGDGLVAQFGCKVLLSSGDLAHNTYTVCPHRFKYHIEQRNGPVLTKTDKVDEIEFKLRKSDFPEFQLEKDMTFLLKVENEIPIKKLLGDQWHSWEQLPWGDRIPIVFPNISVDPFRRRMEKLLEHLRMKIRLKNRTSGQQLAEAEVEIAAIATRPLHDVIYWRLCRLLKARSRDLRDSGSTLIPERHADRQTVIECAVNFLLKTLAEKGFGEDAVEAIDKNISKVKVKRTLKPYLKKIFNRNFLEMLKTVLNDLRNVETWVLEEYKRGTTFGKRLASDELIRQLYTVCDDENYGVHAEARLLLRKVRSSSAEDPEEHIGISKRCCAQCTLLLQCIPYHRNEDRYFRIVGSHGIAFANWRIHSSLKGDLLQRFLGDDLFRIFKVLVEADNAGGQISPDITLQQLAIFVISNIGRIADNREIRKQLNLLEPIRGGTGF